MRLAILRNTLLASNPFTALHSRGIHSVSGEGNLHRIAAIPIAALLFWTVASSPADPLKLIVFPLDGGTTSNQLEWLGEGIAVSLSTQLDSRGIKVMDHDERSELVESLDLPPGARLSRGSMIRVAQRASADLMVMGTYAGTDRNLRISVRVLDVKALKLSGEMSANGPLSVLPQMENELAWLILTNMGLEQAFSREKFQERTRKIPNSAYAYYIESLGSATESDQIHLLLKSVEAYRDFSDAQFRLGRLYFHKGDCSNALPHLTMGRSEASGNLESEFMGGTCYLQGDQPLQAIQAYSRILQITRPFEVLNNIGVAYMRKGDITLALNALLEAKTLARTDTAVSLNLAIVRHLHGNDTAARSVVEEAIKAHPKNGMLQFFLGFLLKMQGESERAETATGKAKSLGINVEKLQMDDPKTWARVIFSWEPSRIF